MDISACGIGPAVWPAIRNIDTDRQTDKHNAFYYIDDLRDDADISRHTRLLYARANMLLRKFFLRPKPLQRSHCSMPFAALFIVVSFGIIFLKNLFVAYMLPSIKPYGFC